MSLRPHVLLARQDNDGDVLLAGPAVRAAAAAAREVTLLVGPRGAQAAELLPCVDRVIVEEAAWIDADPDPVRREAVEGFVDRLADLRVDVGVVLTSFHQSPLPLALLLRMAGVPRTGAISVDYPGALLDVRHRCDDDVHEVQRSLSLMQAMGFTLPPGDDGALRLRELPAVDRPFGERPYLVVHPGASVPARAWAPERHAELVAELASAGWSVAVTGAPSETALTATVAGELGAGDQVADLGGRTTFAQLAAILAGAGGLVVGNTGPAHLAAAVGTPVVEVYALTVPAVRWRPWGVRHELLFHDVPCAGCRARSCPVPGHPCVGDVSVGAVLAAVARVAGPAPARSLEEAAA